MCPNNKRAHSFTVTVDVRKMFFQYFIFIAREDSYRCIRELAPELSEKFSTICELNSYFFELKLISYVSSRFIWSMSTFLANLKKIGQGHIFALSRDQVTEQN